MFLVEVYQVMQSQEYGEALFTEAVAGFTATGFNLVCVIISLRIIKFFHKL